MFTFHCPRHGAEALVFSSNVDGVQRTRRGLEVAFHCTCGQRGVYVFERAVA